MKAILNNQSIDLSDTLLSLALYGYGCFTTFLVDDEQRVKGFHYHLERLLNDAKILFLQMPDQTMVEKNIINFLTVHQTSRPLIVRVTLFPKDFSLQSPELIKGFNILVTGRPPSSPAIEPLKLTCVTTVNALAHQKTTNLIPYLRARAIAHQRGYTDALLVTTQQKITEGPTWNIFFGINNRLYTPKLTDGVLPGITRRLMIENPGEFIIEETTLSTNQLTDFQYCFLTNATMGIMPVESIDKFSLTPQTNHINLLKSNYESLSESLTPFLTA